MTLPDSTVFDTTCPQLFTRWHDEFTFSNDTVTAPTPARPVFTGRSQQTVRALWALPPVEAC